MLEPRQSHPTNRLTPALFATAGITFVVSLFCPTLQVFVDSDPIPGLTVLYTVMAQTPLGLAQCTIEGNWVEVGELTPFLLGFMANITLLTSVFLGAKLHRTLAMPMLLWSINGLAAGLSVPFVLGSYSFAHYDELHAGYWLWIGTLALVAAGWGSVMWNQKRERARTLPGPTVV